MAANPRCGRRDALRSCSRRPRRIEIVSSTVWLTDQHRSGSAARAPRPSRRSWRYTRRACRCADAAQLAAGEGGLQHDWPASIAPSASPAPTTVCNSSMKEDDLALGACVHLLAGRPSAAPRTRRGTSRRRSALPMSSATTLLLFQRRSRARRRGRSAGARPSAMAVLPTPGSPMRTGLFLVRREST